MTTNSGLPPNRLAGQRSPYLLQHAYNPVDWYPWGPEAFARAKTENKPVFLSIGYATCHWCHVMAHESFEDPGVAQALADHFIAVKVDREERPDVDQVYMAACQALTGQGGWPLSAFLTPEGRPFFVGTYFPKENRSGRPGFLDLVRQLGEKWRTDETVVRRAADQLTQVIQDPVDPQGPELGSATFHEAYQGLARMYDVRWGGFGRTPKFPTPSNLGFLFRYAHCFGETEARNMAEATLLALRRGGIFDQLGLGFHRYSVDEKWLVPHFEKMLYDQALLTLAFVEAFQVTGRDLFARAARDVIHYVLRRLTSPEGAFFSAEDADSEGVEGRFYVFRHAEIMDLLGPEAGERFSTYYGVTAEGNFEDGFNVLAVRRPLKLAAQGFGLDPEVLEKELEEGRRRLLAYRNQRPRPQTDDKIVTATSGLMIAALARAGAVLDDPAFTQAAGRAADWILETMVTPQGQVLRAARGGQVGGSGFLDDHAWLVWGLIELYEAGFDPRYLEKALELTRAMLDRFQDPDTGELYFTGRDNETLVARKKDTYDGATPSAASVAVLNLARLGRMTGDGRLENQARRVLAAMAPTAAAYPLAHLFLLQAALFLEGPTREIVVAGDPDTPEAREILRVIRRRFSPFQVLLFKTPGPAGDRLAQSAPFTRAMSPAENGPRVFVCQNYSCRTPVTDPRALERLLDQRVEALKPDRNP